MPDNMINGFVDLSEEAKKQKKQTRQENERLAGGFAYMSYDFVPVNMSLKENKKYHGQRGYETEEAMWFSSLIDNLLSEQNNGELSISKTDMAALTLHRDRMHTEVLLNTKKFSGDSGEMAAVKEEVGKLERILKESISLNESTLNEIERQYDAAIGACRDYMNNKNPWFATGIERKAMVEATLERVSNEKKTFVEARNAYANETLLDQGEITRPWELLVYQLRDKEAKKRERKAYEDRLKEEEEANGQFLDNLCGENNERYHAFYEKARQDNPYLKDEDIRFIFYCSFLNKFETGVKDENGAEDPSPLFKDFGRGAALNRKYVEEGLAVDGDFTRMVNPAFKIVKRNAAGEPLNEKEQEKENWNNSFVECIENYYAAKKKVMEADKALKEAPAEDKAVREAAGKAKDEAEANLAKKRESLWSKYEEHFKTFLKDIYIPTVEEYKENPAFYADLLKKDISLYYQLRQLGGMWNEIKDFGLDAYKARFKAENPDLMIKMHILSRLKSYESQAVFEPHMMTSTFAVDGDCNYKRYRDVIDNQQATAEEKAEAQQDYDDYLAGHKEQLESMNQMYAEQMEACAKMKNASKDEIKLFNFKMEMQIDDEVKAESAQLKEKGIELKPSVIEYCILARNAMDFKKYQPGYDDLQEKMKEKHKNKVMSREVAVLIKPVLRDKAGRPFDAEEQKKQDWNKRWLEIFDDETKKEEKKQMVVEHLTNILSDVRIPSPREIKEKGLGYFLAKDPIYYLGLAKQNLGIDNMRKNEEFKPIVDDLFKKHPEMEMANRMIAEFSQLYVIFFGSEYVEIEKQTANRVEPFQPVDKKKYDERSSQESSEEKEERYRIILETTFTPAYYEYQDELANKKWKRSARFEESQDVIDEWRKDKNIRIRWDTPTRNPARHRALINNLNAQADKDMGEIVSDLSKLSEPADFLSAMLGGYYIKKDEKIMNAVEAGYYYVKRDRAGKPVGREEERKERHNKQWIEAWRQLASALKRKKGQSAMINEARRQRASKTIIKLFTEYVRDLSRKPQPDLNKLDTERKKKRFLYSDSALRMNLGHFSDKYLDRLEEFVPGVKEAVKKNVEGFEEKNRIWTQLGEPWVDGVDDWGKKNRK